MLMIVVGVGGSNVGKPLDSKDEVGQVKATLLAELLFHLADAALRPVAFAARAAVPCLLAQVVLNITTNLRRGIKPVIAPGKPKDQPQARLMACPGS